MRGTTDCFVLQSLLQQLLTQLVATQTELHAANGSLGQKFQLSEHIKWMKEKGKLAAANEQRRRPSREPALRNGNGAATNGVADMEDDSNDH